MFSFYVYHLEGGGDWKCLQGFGGETCRLGDHLEDPGVGVRIVLKCMFEKWVEGHGLDRSGSG